MRAERGPQDVTRRRFLAGAAGAAAAAGAWAAGGAPAWADALGPFRAIHLRNAHGERYNGVYHVAGGYVPEALEAIDWVLRDNWTGAVAEIDPRLIDLASLMQQAVGRREMVVTSGYRSRRTNERLRRETGRAARNSFHVRGMAMDFFCPKVPVDDLADLGRRLGAGGVGQYDALGFVHIDVGEPRVWRG